MRSGGVGCSEDLPVFGGDEISETYEVYPLWMMTYGTFGTRAGRNILVGLVDMFLGEHGDTQKHTCCGLANKWGERGKFKEIVCIPREPLLA